MPLGCKRVVNRAPFQLLQAKQLNKYVLTVSEAQKVSICKRAPKWRCSKRQDTGNGGGLSAFAAGEGEDTGGACLGPTRGFPFPTQISSLSGFRDIMSSFSII